MNVKKFSATDITLIGMFCTLWTILNLFLAPLGFAWFGLPIFCDFAVFFTLLLTTWTTGKFGAATLVGTIGSALTLMLRAGPQIIGFAVAAVLFDVLMLTSNHRLNPKIRSISVAAFSTMASAYFAGVTIGILFLRNSLEWSLTVWGGWHLTGAAITLIIALPIVATLEKANVRRIMNA